MVFTLVLIPSALCLPKQFCHLWDGPCDLQPSVLPSCPCLIAVVQRVVCRSLARVVGGTSHDLTPAHFSPPSWTFCSSHAKRFEMSQQYLLFGLFYKQRHAFCDRCCSGGFTYLLTRLNLVTTLSLEEKLSKRGSGMSHGRSATGWWARLKRGVGLCLNLPWRPFLMLVLSLCQEPLLGMAICMVLFQACQPRLCCHFQGLFTLFLPFASVRHVQHKVITCTCVSLVCL